MVPGSSPTLRRVGMLGPEDELLASCESDNVMAAGRELRDVFLDLVQCCPRSFSLVAWDTEHWGVSSGRRNRLKGIELNPRTLLEVAEIWHTAH